MPMQTYSPCPRPILKRSSTVPSASNHEPNHYYPSPTSDSSNPLLNIDPSILTPLVHFAPHTALARTFTAYSPSAYDRSPIVVTPNKCSLPERGCPGKTYVPLECRSSAATGYLRPSSKSGHHLHPRASREVSYMDEEVDDDNDLTPIATPTIYSQSLPPPLLSDASSSSSSSSSSSESDESDGFHSPSAEASIVDFSSLYVSSPKPTSFLPHPRSPTSPPTPTQSSSPSSLSLSPAPSIPTPSPRRRRMSPRRSSGKPRAAVVSVSPLEVKYKTLSDGSMLGGCGLSVPDVGCFGGF